ETAAAPPARRNAVLVLSARAEPALKALEARYAERLAQAGDEELAAICHSAASRRAALEYRVVFVTEGREALVEALRRYLAGEAPSAEGRVPDAAPAPPLAYVLPGQGAQWRGMARELLREEAAFRVALERCDAAARPWLGLSLIQRLQAEPGSAQDAFERIDVVQPLLVSLALAYAAWWASIGVRPAALVGHSMG